MKNLADLKRHLKIGMILNTEHLQSNWNPGPRKILSINSMGFTLETSKADGTLTASHANYPPATYFEPIENGFIFFSDWYVAEKEEKRVPLLRYTFTE